MEYHVQPLSWVADTKKSEYTLSRFNAALHTTDDNYEQIIVRKKILLTNAYEILNEKLGV